MKLRPSTRALAIAMTAGVLMSTAAVPAMAADSIEITPPDRPWEVIHPSGGVVSASISEADQQRLRDAGYDVTVRPDGDNVSIDWNADDARVREVTGLVDGTSASGEPLSFDTDLGILADNIHEKSQPAPYATMRAGQDSAYRSLAYTRDEHTVISAASVSSWRHGGVDGLTEVSTTRDTYREYNADRQAKVEKENRRGHYLPNLSQCYDRTDVCGFWIQPAAYGSDPEVEGLNGTLRAATDAIWVSVDTKAGLPEPANYTDAGGHIHRFTLDTAATGRPADALSTSWRNAPGRDEQNRVLPQLELMRSWTHRNGEVTLGIRSTVSVSQRLDVVDAEAGEYLYTISAGEDLDGRAWRIRTDSGFEGEIYARDDAGRIVVSDVTLESAERQDVVLRVTVRSEDESVTARPVLTGASIGAFSGAQPAQTASWQQAVYTQETEFVMPELPEPPRAPQPPRGSSNIPLSCSGGYRIVVMPDGSQQGFILPNGTYDAALTRAEVNARIADMTEEERGCPIQQPEPPVEQPEPQPEPPVVDVPETPQPPVVDVPETPQPVEQPPVVDVPEVVQPEPEAPVASPEPPVTVVDQPLLDPAPQPETEPVVATAAPVAEDEPEFLAPLRPETGVDGTGAREVTGSSASPSVLSLLIAAATAVAGVVLYGGSRPVRLRRRYVARHARD